MKHKIAAIKARQNLGELLNRVALRRDEFIIERGGRPLAAMIPIEKFEQIKDAAHAVLSFSLRKSRRSVRRLSIRAKDALLDEAKHRSRPRRKA